MYVILESLVTYLAIAIGYDKVNLYFICILTNMMTNTSFKVPAEQQVLSTCNWFEARTAKRL